MNGRWMVAAALGVALAGPACRAHEGAPGLQADPRAAGPRDKDLVRLVIHANEPQIRQCYEQGLALDPTLSGKVSIQWQIDADGSASRAMVSPSATTLQDARVHECMMARITSWKFPAPRGGGVAIITYPWILRSSGGEE